MAKTPKDSAAGTTPARKPRKSSTKAPAASGDAPAPAGAEGDSPFMNLERDGGPGIEVPPLPESAYPQDAEPLPSASEMEDNGLGAALASGYPPGSIALPGDGWEFDEGTDEWVHECGFRRAHDAVLTDAKSGRFTDDEIDAGHTDSTLHDCADFDDRAAFDALKADSDARALELGADPSHPVVIGEGGRLLRELLESDIPPDGLARVFAEPDGARGTRPAPVSEVPTLVVGGVQSQAVSGTIDDVQAANRAWAAAILVPLDRNGTEIPQGARVCMPGHGSRAGRAARYTEAGLVAVELDGPIRDPATNAIRYELEVAPGECILEASP